MSGVAHFFMVVRGSKFHERAAHFFVDIYILISKTIAVSTFDKKQYFVICILHAYDTVQTQVFHGKKAANSLEFTAFLRNEPFFY